MRLTALFLFPLLLISALLPAQEFKTETFQVQSTKGTEPVQALVYFPTNFVTTKKYPLVLYSHGLGEAGSDITKLYNTGLPKVLKAGYRPAFDFIMVAVQSPTYSISPSWLPAIVAQAKQKWTIDSNRLYITGISAGGWSAYGSQLNVSPDFARKFAGIAVVSGGTQNINKSNLTWWINAKTPLWSVVGGDDASYLLQNTELVKSLNQGGTGLAQLTVRPGKAHDAWDDVYRGLVKNGALDIWQWLYQFDRSSAGLRTGTTSEVQNTTLMSTVVSSTTGTKQVKVNLFGGTNSYSNAEWNNWNVASSLSSGALKYSDGTISTAAASVSQSNGVQDNGSTYGGTMSPPEVLRYTTSSGVTRTLTLSGLNPSKTYSLELYASRGTSGNSTLFTAGGTSVTIATYNNKSNKASFSGLTPTAGGQIVVSIAKLNTYNYLNGFILTENDEGVVNPPVASGYANHIMPATSGYVNYANGFPITNLKPGDTINVMAGTYTTLIFGNFKGDASRPIVIRNRGGQVKTGEIRIVNDAQYFKILGNGHPGVQYGFKVYRTEYSGINIPQARDFEIAYCEVHGMNVGIFIKNNPVSTDPSTIYPNYTFKNIYLHHNFVHDIKKEGMYIGHSDPDGGQDGNPLLPVRHENIEIAYNIVNATGWDGIQLGNARTGNKIHHNTVTNYGTLNASGQRSGIEIGTNTNADIYDNTVNNGRGTGIMIFGYGPMNVYNNVLEKCGSGHFIYANPYLTGPEVNPKQQMNVYNNTIRYPNAEGAIKVGGLSANSLPSIIQNNKLLILNPSSTWQKTHCYSVVPGSTISGNTLITQ